jgi:ketosteroid isomerase-like protein
MPGISCLTRVLNAGEVWMNPSWISDLFAAIDHKDAYTFASYLAEDATFQFGNAPPIHGREPIREGVARFFSSIHALQHTLHTTWSPPETVICEGLATYTRHDSSTLTVPFANVLKLEGSLVRHYQIYVDISALYAGG